MITVKFFASLKRAAGCGEMKITEADIDTVGVLIKYLKKKNPALGRALAAPGVSAAVNHKPVGREAPVRDGDEAAFLPPMSGGDGWVRLQTEAIATANELERIKKTSKNIGAVVMFLGTAREFSRGKVVKALEFEHYPKMAEKQLESIRSRALKKFNLLQVSIVHRLGTVDIGENIVLVLAAAEHRAEAFAAGRWIIDTLKKETPIWKKEITDEGESWI